MHELAHSGVLSMVTINPIHKTVQFLLGLFVHLLRLPLSPTNEIHFLHKRLPSAPNRDLLGDLQGLERSQCELGLLQGLGRLANLRTQCLRSLLISTQVKLELLLEFLTFLCRS